MYGGSDFELIEEFYSEGVNEKKRRSG